MTNNFFQHVIANFLNDLERLLPVLAGKIVAFLVLCFIWPKLTGFVLRSFEKAMKLKDNDPLLISFLKSLIKTFMYIVLAFMLIGILGIKATSLVTILGTAGVAVGLALQGSLSNLASGILILFFKQISKGDVISSVDRSIEGVVKNIYCNVLYYI